jgi:hypothetical protein
LDQERVVSSLKAKILCLAQAILGAYCLIQGLLLLGSGDPLTQWAGIGLFLWLPGCGYYTWQGRTAYARRATAPKVAQAPSQVVGTAMAPIID